MSGQVAVARPDPGGSPDSRSATDGPWQPCETARPRAGTELARGRDMSTSKSEITRKESRVPFAAHVILTRPDGVSAPGRFVNLSVGGACLETLGAVDRDDQLQLLVDPATHSVADVTGTVAWTTPLADERRRI